MLMKKKLLKFTKNLFLLFFGRVNIYSDKFDILFILEFVFTL